MASLSTLQTLESFWKEANDETPTVPPPAQSGQQMARQGREIRLYSQVYSQRPRLFALANRTTGKELNHGRPAIRSNGIHRPRHRRHHGRFYLPTVCPPAIHSPGTRRPQPGADLQGPEKRKDQERLPPRALRSTRLHIVHT